MSGAEITDVLVVGTTGVTCKKASDIVFIKTNIRDIKLRFYYLPLFTPNVGNRFSIGREGWSVNVESSS